MYYKRSHNPYNLLIVCTNSWLFSSAQPTKTEKVTTRTNHKQEKI